MADSFKPKGYTTVSPYLIVTGAPLVIDFLKRTFEAVSCVVTKCQMAPSCTRKYG